MAIEIKYLAFPQWFWNANTFKLETDSTKDNYLSVKERVCDYSTFPAVTPPINQVLGCGEYKYDDIKAMESSLTRTDPSAKIGYTHFPKMIGFPETTPSTGDFFNAHSPSNQIRFANEGGVLADNNLNLGGGTNEAIQWINGEQGIGYAIDPSLAPRIKSMIDNLHNLQPNTKYGVYSLQAFGIWQQFYEIYPNSGVTTREDELCNMLENPPNSIMELSGFDFLMEDLYSLGNQNTQVYTAIGIFSKQLARKKYALTGKEIYKKLIYILWSNTENFAFNYNYKLNSDGKMVTAGHLNGLTKQPANPEHNYNLALHGALHDGFIHFIDRLSATGTQNINGQQRNLERENVNFGVQVSLRQQVYIVGFPVIWHGINQLANITIWQTSFLRNIIDETSQEWFTPDFTYNGNFRTGKYKQIPYNLKFQEPTVEMKFSANKSSCLIYAANLSTAPSTVPKIVKVKFKNASNVDVEVPIVLRGNKAEVVAINL